MATLVLGAVGNLVAGPIGGAVGAVIGNQIDRALFSPAAAKGPRLGSLAIQQSSYGSDLPRLFGTMRVAGAVIWATDLKEHASTSGGKGARTTSYAYSASFAVAVSARAILSVGRIWADGNLLRGAGGDWKSKLGAFRLHLGDEAQTPDPLIAAAEGLSATPAHRGLAYAVFEDLQLADFGYRIPSLSFELVADAGPVTLGGIAAELSDGEIGGPAGPALAGYAATGDSLRGAIEALAGALPVSFADGPEGLLLVDEAADPIALAAAETGGAAGEGRAPRLALDRRAAGTLNQAIAISYYDPALDFQLGSQGARRGAAARRAGTVALPAAADAAAAKAIAEARLAREWAERSTATLTLPWARLAIAAGAIVALPGQPGRWRVTRRRLEAMVVTLTAVPLPPPAAPLASADSGRSIVEPDFPAGATTLALLDLPPIGDDLPPAPRLLIAAAGASPGWRGATLLGSLDGGASWATLGRTAPAATLGFTAAALAPADAMLVDERNEIEVLLLNDSMLLAGDSVLGLSATANLALIGSELVQFGRAEQVGPARYRLGRLLRGRRGTEGAIGDHAAGEPVVLIDPATAFVWELPAAAIGTTLMVAASGLGDASPAQAAILFQAHGLRPPAPVALRAACQPDGSVLLGWTRRSRAGWPWLDGIDAPLAEESERYRVELARAGGAVTAIETGQPSLLVAATTLAALPGSGPVTAAIAQIGTAAASLPPASLVLPEGN